MPRIPNDQIDDIRNRTDIVDLIASYGLSPVRKGRVYVTLCPFHDDHNPSLQIDPTRQRFRCWVDGSRGGVYDFVMMYENVDFAQAVETLAKRLNIELRYEGQSAEEVQKAKSRGEWRNYLYELNAMALQFFKSQLKTSAAVKALEYLHSRKLKDETIDAWDLGWAPADGQALWRHLSQKKATAKSLHVAGLVRDYGNEVRDYFTAQITFPFRDVTNRVLGFSARKMPDDERPIGKYINTPTTPVFSKSKAVFGIDKAYKRLTRDRRLVICEGQMDVILCHQHGFTDVVALSGTAAAVDGLRVIKRHAADVVALTDSDAAGQEAAERIVPLFLELSMGGRIAVIPETEDDPADMLAAGKEQKLAEIIETAKDAFTFKLDRWVKDRNLGNSSHVAEIAKEMMRTASASSDPVIRQTLRRQVAQRLLIDETALAFDAKRTAPPPSAKISAEDESLPEPSTPAHKAERDLLSALLRDLSLIDRAYEYTDLDFYNFSGPGHRDLAMAILSADTETERPEGSPIKLSDVQARLSGQPAIQRLAEDLVDAPPGRLGVELNPVNEFDKRARKMCEYLIDQRLQTLTREAAQARETKDADKLKIIEREMVELSKKKLRCQSPEIRKRQMRNRK